MQVVSDQQPNKNSAFQVMTMILYLEQSVKEQESIVLVFWIVESFQRQTDLISPVASATIFIYFINKLSSKQACNFHEYNATFSELFSFFSVMLSLDLFLVLSQMSVDVLL